MPIPHPHTGEEQSAFVSRCMGNEAMQEYEQEQRAAICYSAWRDRDKPQKASEIIAHRQRGSQLVTADWYLKSMALCIAGIGTCDPSLWGMQSAERYVEVMKEAATQLTFAAPDALIGDMAKSGAPSLTPGSILDFDAVITSTKKDRDSDILETGGAMLDPKAPLLLFHNPERPVGRLVSKTKHTTDIMAGRFAIFDTAEGRDAAVLVEGGAMRISHGFDPMEFEPLQQKDGRWHVLKFVILEVSLVPIPSNTDAVIMAFSRGKLHTPLIKSWAQKAYDARPVQGIGFGNLKTVEAEVVKSETHECSCQKSKPATNGKARLEQKADEQDPIRWNKSLSKSFDVANEQLMPASVVYDWASKYLEVPIKKIFDTETEVPSARMGSWLMAFRQLTSEYTTVDVRNIYGSSEVPPKYEEIQLNSKTSETFLIHGTTFYRYGKSSLIVSVEPAWWGLRVRGFVRDAERSRLTDLFKETWKLAKEKNYLKGEAFALSGEFLERGDQKWDDVYLLPKNAEPLKRTLKNINEKGAGNPNRGIVMMGPPGTGKTLSGRVIKDQADCTYIWISARDFYRSGSFGGFAYAFDLAKELAPTVLFVEDVDNFMGPETIDLLKTEMDGLRKTGGIVTFLTTNYPERFPNALLDRPGRFHDVLKFDLPDETVRLTMLAKWLPGLSADDLRAAVERTKGYSGAHVYELSYFAKSLCESDELALHDALVKALDKIDEQRELIDRAQLAGSNYRPRRAFSRTEEKAMSPNEKTPATQETPGPQHASNEERYRGQGPQAGDRDFTERYNSERVGDDGVTNPGGDSTNPLGSTMNDEAGKIATGASGSRNPENPMDLLPAEGTNTPGKRSDVQRLDGDDSSYHDVAGNIDSEIHPGATKGGRKISAKNMKRLAEIEQHLDHMDGMGPEHVSVIAKAHVAAAKSHVGLMIKEGNSMDPDGDGSYARAQVPGEDGHNAGSAGTDTFGTGARLDPNQNGESVTGPNIPGSVSTQIAFAKLLLDADELDTESLVTLREVCSLVLNEKQAELQATEAALDWMIAVELEQSGLA